jgi:hypothetical protein
LRFSACLVYHCALRARPAGVAWINSGNRDCLPHRLVLRKLAKLIEGPSCKTAALRLSNLRPLADVRQVFQRNRRTGAFGGSNNLLGNNVVGLLAKAGLLPAELLQAKATGWRSRQLRDGAGRPLWSPAPAGDESVQPVQSGRPQGSLSRIAPTEGDAPRANSGRECARRML